MRCEKSLWVVGICPSFKGIRLKLKMMQETEWSFSVYPGNCWQPHLQVQSNHSKSSGSPFLATCLIKEYHFGVGSCRGFPDSSVGKESTCNAGDPCSVPALGRSPGEGKGYPLQCSGLENSMHCIVHGVAKSQTQLSDLHFRILWFKSHLPRCTMPPILVWVGSLPVSLPQSTSWAPLFPGQSPQHTFTHPNPYLIPWPNETSASTLKRYPLFTFLSVNQMEFLQLALNFWNSLFHVILTVQIKIPKSLVDSNEREERNKWKS